MERDEGVEHALDAGDYSLEISESLIDVVPLGDLVTSG